MDLLRTGMIGKLMPDDALLHELVHTLRMMSGQATTLDLGALRYTQRWGNTEELYAVLIANTYVSERNGRYGSRQPLRGNVGPVDQFTPLSADKARSQVFLKTYRPLLKELCDQMIGLTHGGGQTGVQHAPAEFNPIRDYLKEWDDLRTRM